MNTGRSILVLFPSLQRQFIYRRFFKKRRKTVLLLPNTQNTDIRLDNAYEAITSVADFGIRSLQGGNNRRAELLEIVNDTNRLHIPKTNHRREIQKKIVEMALDIALQSLSNNIIYPLVLDLGCGSDVAALYPSCTEKNYIHVIGLDSFIRGPETSRNPSSGNLLDVIQGDMCNNLPLRTCVFDVVLSVSALQWLFVHPNSHRLLDIYFRSLRSALCCGGTGTVQFYPRNAQDVQDVIKAADVYFKGALIADYPHPERGKKLFLYIMNP